MILEIAGSRVLAPYVGSSTFVWTSIIGVILGSLSIGYWLGGSIADKNPNRKTLSKILFLSAVLIGVIAIVKDPVLSAIQESISNIKVASVVAATVLFAVPSIFLGMVSPYCVRLKMTDVSSSGKTVGNLYAISTIGSIVGTFLAGFFLISYFGNTKLLYILTIILLFTSLLAYAKKNSKLIVILIGLLIAQMFMKDFSSLKVAGTSVLDFDTNYSRVWIYDDTDYYTEYGVRRMKRDNSNSSAMFTENGLEGELVFPYSRYYNLMSHFNPNFESALMIGGAAYSYPKYFLSHFRDATLHVVEIDPKLTELAQDYFDLKDSPRLRITHEDGRTFLNKNEEKYDAILGDAFGSIYSVPFHLTTLEAVEHMNNALTDDGIVLINLIGTLQDKGSKFIHAEYNTFKKVFPHVFLVPVTSTDEHMRQNIMLMAFKSPKVPKLSALAGEAKIQLQNVYSGEIPDTTILTDDFAPVDQYISELL